MQLLIDRGVNFDNKDDCGQKALHTTGQRMYEAVAKIKMEDSAAVRRRALVLSSQQTLSLLLRDIRRCWVNPRDYSVGICPWYMVKLETVLHLMSSRTYNCYPALISKKCGELAYWPLWPSEMVQEFELDPRLQNP
jgi:hypothetical protein